MVLETHMKLCVWAGFSGKSFIPQNWENGLKMGPKQGFLNLLKNFVINFYWICCCIMKIYIIYSVFSQSDCRNFYSTLSPEQIIEIAWFF